MDSPCQVKQPHIVRPFKLGCFDRARLSIFAWCPGCAAGYRMSRAAESRPATKNFISCFIGRFIRFIRFIRFFTVCLARPRAAEVQPDLASRPMEQVAYATCSAAASRPSILCGT